MQRCAQRICRSEFRPLFGHGVEAGCHFVLTSSRHFVVVSFNYRPSLPSPDTWWNGCPVKNRPEEPGSNRLSRGTVTFVTTFVFGGGSSHAPSMSSIATWEPDRGTETNVIEQEEFWLWPEQNGVCDAGRTQVLFCTFSDGRGSRS